MVYKDSTVYHNKKLSNNNCCFSKKVQDFVKVKLKLFYLFFASPGSNFALDIYELFVLVFYKWKVYIRERSESCNSTHKKGRIKNKNKIIMKK
jgi:hypothetical protein